MQHAAIDLGSKESQICIRQPDGTIIEERKLPTRKLTELVQTWPTSRVVMEASAEAFKIADAAIAAGHQVRVVPGTLVRLLGVGERGVKNDRKDARQLSKASWQTDVPSVHIPSHAARELKSICGARDVLVATQRTLSNNVRGWLRTQLWKLPSGKMVTLPERLRTHARASNRELPEHIERQLTMLTQVAEQVKAANQQARKLAAEHPVCRRLMTVPGVGPIIALRFVAAIDDPSRFSTAHRVQSYLGLTPGEHSSGGSGGKPHGGKTGITKAGPNELRRCLVQGAWAAMRARRPHPMLEWARQIAERRSRPVAAVALARKLAGILFAIWRDGTTYEPQRAARRSAPM
jgi:transposase